MPASLFSRLYLRRASRLSFPGFPRRPTVPRSTSLRHFSYGAQTSPGTARSSSRRHTPAIFPARANLPFLPPILQPAPSAASPIISAPKPLPPERSEEHTSELQSLRHL